MLSAPSRMLPRPSGLVTLLTDFGARDPYVGILKGALVRASSKVQVLDIGHEVPPQDIAAGAFWAWSLIDRFPSGAVHVVVVDPGVGTARRLLAVAAHETYWLAPDNGVLGAVLAADPTAEVRELDLTHLQIRPESRTFHGRDVLAPIAAWLAGGRYGFSALGPRCGDPVRDVDPFAGAPRVIHVDHFGNLITNLAAEKLGGATAVAIGGRHLPLAGTYGETAPGELLALVGSFGLLEIARHGGSAAQELGLTRGAPVALVAR